MRKISKILMRKLYGKRICVSTVDGHIKNWELECGLHQWQAVGSSEMNKHGAYEAGSLTKQLSIY
jgi:hypothetical protein